MAGLLELKNLSIHFDTERGRVGAVKDVSFSLKKRETHE